MYLQVAKKQTDNNEYIRYLHNGGESYALVQLTLLRKFQRERKLAAFNVAMAFLGITLNLAVFCLFNTWNVLMP